MLVIRTEQMKVLEQDLFYRWVTDYLKRCYRAKCRRTGHAKLREMAVDAVNRARGRGYESSDSILKYVHATFLLGGDLETSPKLQWARHILDDADNPVPAERLTLLEDTILSRMEQGI